jgi:hypothetical protein
MGISRMASMFGSNGHLPIGVSSTIGLRCEVCDDLHHSVKPVNKQELVGKSGIALFYMCNGCFEKTTAKIAELKTNPQNLPLYINDPNIFLREFAINSLKEAQSA